METTKIYIIVGELTSWGRSADKIIGFTLSKEDAEYEVWKLNKQARSAEFTSTRFSYSEIPAIVITNKNTNEKEYKAFKAERIAAIKESIESRTSCKNKDIEALASLEESLRFYEDKK